MWYRKVKSSFIALSVVIKLENVLNKRADFKKIKNININVEMTEIYIYRIVYVN